MVVASASYILVFLEVKISQKNTEKIYGFAWAILLMEEILHQLIC